MIDDVPAAHVLNCDCPECRARFRNAAAIVDVVDPGMFSAADVHLAHCNCEFCKALSGADFDYEWPLPEVSNG